MRQLKPDWEHIGLSNDFMFGKIMRKPALCKRMLELILSIKIERIEYIEPQKNIDEDQDARSIRLDIYVRDSEEASYCIEIQTTNTRELPKRSRYYQSMLDVQQLNKGETYRTLKRSYVIFICTFDLFHQGRHIYTFENRCLENGALRLEDEAYKLFLNTEGVLDDVSQDLMAFLNYVGGRKSDNIFVEELDKELQLAKQNQKWRREYMTLWMRDQENIEKGRAEGRAEGLSEGRAEGLSEGRAEGLSEGLSKGAFRMAELAERLFQDNRVDDLRKAKNDALFREKLYQEYQL